MNAFAEETVIPFCREKGIRMVIGDNDAKLHSKGLYKLFQDAGIELYVGSGKRTGVHENGYPPRSHDCNPCETYFANIFTKAQERLEWREDHGNKTRTMLMWKYSLDKTIGDYEIAEVRKLIDRQQKIMDAIIAVQGGRTKY